MIGIPTFSLSLILLIMNASCSNIATVTTVTATSINEIHTRPKGRILFREELLSE